MSKREKTIVLYSRNGIKIDKTDFLDMTKWSNLRDNNVFVFNEVKTILKKKDKKERPGVTEIREIYDDATDSFVRRKVRVVYVDWNDPLPKKEKGIIYERPNKEPVIFPGDFGYDKDYSMNEWALSEEIAADEYCVNNERKFDNDKVGKSSIGDILGDNNPLLKLKEKLS